MRRISFAVLIPLMLVGFFTTTQPAAAAEEKTPEKSCTESGGTWQEDGKECLFVDDKGNPDTSKITGSMGPKIRACLGSQGVWTGNSCTTKKSNGGSLTSNVRVVVNALLFLAGVAAVIVIVIAGLRFVTANGESQSVAKAKNSIIYAVVGIVVAISAYAIVNFILDQF